MTSIRLGLFQLLGALLVALVLLQNLATASSSNNRLEVDFGDGKKSNNIIELKESSGSDSQSVNKRSAYGAESRNIINRKQQRTNTVGTGLEMNPYNRKQLMKMVRYIAKHGGLRRGYRTKRTVESPARSTDTGGRPSQTGISANIAKLFSSRSGHYSDIYDDIDFKKPINSTQKPVESTETLVRIDSVKKVQQNY